jgi:hypothetical protein
VIESQTTTTSLAETRRLKRIAHLDRRYAVPMFLVTLTSLVALAGIIHLHGNDEYDLVFWVCASAALMVYPAHWFEVFTYWQRGSVRWHQRLLYCVLPPLRLGARDQATGQMVWLPGLGWQQVNRALVHRVTKALNWPMIGLALVVLPLIAIEYLCADTLNQRPDLARWVEGATAFIWLAFTAEFVVQWSVADRRWQYCRDHFVDLAIILLPVLAFARAAQLGRLMRVPQLARTAQVYRLRGVSLRAWRALVVTRGVKRILEGGTEKQLVKLRQRIQLKEAELGELRAEERELELELAAKLPGHGRTAA